MDNSDRLSHIARPRMLVRAARFGANTARKRRDRGGAKAIALSFDKLFEEEARLDEARRSGDAGYSPSRHVEVLANLLAAAS